MSQTTKPIRFGSGRTETEFSREVNAPNNQQPPVTVHACSDCGVIGSHDEGCPSDDTQPPAPAATLEHSPLPWETLPEKVIVAEPERVRVVIRAANSYRVVVEENPARWEQALADFEFIVSNQQRIAEMIAALKLREDETMELNQRVRELEAALRDLSDEVINAFKRGLGRNDNQNLAQANVNARAVLNRGGEK